MNEVNKEELRRLAEAASHKDWYAGNAFDKPFILKYQIITDTPDGKYVLLDGNQNFREDCVANVAFVGAANPAAVLSLMDELSQATLQCAKHGKALQEIGAALSLSAGSDLHKQCVPEIYRLLQSIGSGVTEAYKERIACQEVIDHLRAENERLRAQLAESQANDRTAMAYLHDIREIVGGYDYPEMIQRIRMVTEAIK